MVGGAKRSRDSLGPVSRTRRSGRVRRRLFPAPSRGAAGRPAPAPQPPRWRLGTRPAKSFLFSLSPFWRLRGGGRLVYWVDGRALSRAVALLAYAYDIRAICVECPIGQQAWPEGAGFRGGRAGRGSPRSRPFNLTLETPGPATWGRPFSGFWGPGARIFFTGEPSWSHGKMAEQGGRSWGRGPGGGGSTQKNIPGRGWAAGEIKWGGRAGLQGGPRGPPRGTATPGLF